MFSLLFVLACSGAKTDSDGTSTSTDSETTTTTTDPGPVCSEITSGDDWAWHGECPQMTTPCVVVFDPETCSFTIDYPSGMTMDMPNAATVVDADVSFSGGGQTNCVGTVTDPEHLTGTCDGCTWELRKGR